MTTDSLLADCLLAAPAVTRLALSAPSERLRQQAAHELAGTILAALEQPPQCYDARQIALPL
jgi:hypothetical protein